MKKMLFIALIAAGFWHWKGNPFSKPTMAVDDDGNAQVVVFTFPECGEPCTDTITALKRRKVPFEEVELSRDEQTSENYKRWEQYGDRNFPLIVAGEEKATGSAKADLVKLLAINFQDDYLTASEAQYYKRHFDSAGEPQIVLYGTDWCPGCAALRKEMRAKNVAFVDIDVEKASDSKGLTETMEIGGYPTVYVGYQRVNGINLAAIEKVL
jgi:glutaredoxin